MPNSITLRKIAEESGVSISTVSRALRKHPSVRPDLRARVEEATRRLEYKPNPLVSVLMEHIRNNRSPVFHGNLALLSWCVNRRCFEEMPVLRRFYEGAKRGADSQGYSLEVFFPMADRLSQRLLMRMLHSRGIIGAVAFIHVEQDPQTLEALAIRSDLSILPIEASKLALAALGGKFDPTSPHFATTDQYAAGFLAAEEILRLGYRQPLLVLSSYLDVITEHRFQAGFQAAWQRNPFVGTLRVEVIREGDSQAVIESVTRHSPDMVLCHSNESLRWLKQADMRVPEDIGFASLDVSPDDPIAGIDQLHEEVGKASVNLVINQINRGESGIPKVTKGVLIEGIWQNGHTLPPRS